MGLKKRAEKIKARGEANQLKPSFENLESILERGNELLEKEELRLKKCRIAFEAEQSLMMEYLQSEDTVVGLNVSGRVLAVSLRILQCFPNSVLAVTFNRERWTEQKQDLDKSGNYMMDHDIYCFTKVGR